MIRHPALIAGARPNFPKVAPLLKAFTAVGIEASLVHTGQHYDAAMSESFFDILGIAQPSINLGVGSGTHGAQTAAVMVAFERWLEQTDVDAVLVVGDVNSTVACALVAAKAGVPVGHVEAGLRAFDRTMPEEINRIVVDSLASWLFTPSGDADANLLAEGVEPSRIHCVGNVMVDSLLATIDRARHQPIVNDLGLTGRPFGLVTLHRPALVDDRARMGAMMDTLNEVSRMLPLVFPVHPRTRAMLDRLDVAPEGRIRFVEPQGYLDFLALEAAASLVITDSGGVQEETTVLGVPCLTVRENTERPVTITQGTNTLVGFDSGAIVSCARRALDVRRTTASVPLWDGKSAERIIEILGKPSPHPTFVPPTLRWSESPEFIAAGICADLAVAATGPP